ncbi:DNA polymerase III subunit beta [Eubacteriales bacterium OttesenSCG-928-K08]|nr:DNA polymerase III subunit beta [Eubacteriales bacterium OttesenSCG-928-K08]
MKLSVDIKTLNSGLATVIKSLSSKPTMPVLEGIYMEATNEGLLLRCSDLSLQIDCLIPAIVEEEGCAVLPGKLFAEFCRKLNGELVDMQLDARKMSIKAGRARTQLQCHDPKEFPYMEVNKEINSLQIPQNVLKEMIRQCVFATATEDSKPILTGVLCEFKEDLFSLVALDGFRLAIRKYALRSKMEEHEAVVPSKSFVEISRTLIDSDEKVKVVFSHTHLLVDMGHTKIVSRLLEGDFIKYRGILPTDHITRVRVNREELLESIDRAMLLAREGSNNLVRFNVEAELMRIFANSPVGRLEEEVPVHLNGDPLEIAFNARYFNDVLKTLTDEEIYLDMNNNVSPCVVRPTQGDAYYYLILPVRIFS